MADYKAGCGPRLFLAEYLRLLLSFGLSEKGKGGQRRWPGKGTYLHRSLTGSSASN